jgi:non-ribosomal peptide synthetase component E (peptide arylation enzyme)
MTVILGEHTAPATPGGSERLATLDELFRATVARSPDRLALVDPADRHCFTDGAVRRFTYGQADRVVSAIARRLLDCGLPANAIVAIQLPNVVESVLVLLGVLRAGLIAVPVPLLWRRADMVRALGRIGARALVVLNRVGTVDHGDMAAHVAAETFAIRFLFGFGDPLPDGVVSLNDVFDAPAMAVAPGERWGDPANHVAVVTFEVTSEGIIPLARSNAQLAAAGAAVISELGAAGAVTRIISGASIASLAGLAGGVLPWLLGEGTLVLQHPFAADVFALQRDRERCTLAVVPGPVLSTLADARVLGSAAVLALWRTPERLTPANRPLADPERTIVDLWAFGEIAVIASRRGPNGNPEAATLTSGGFHRAGAPLRVEATRSRAGTLALRGAIVPRHQFPLGTERGGPLRLKIDESGFVDTGYPCRLDRATNRIVVTGPPSGIVSVGGYRMALRELEETVARIDPESSVAALPDALIGQRLAGVATDRRVVQRALAAQGAQPLLTAAFGGHRQAKSHSTA